MHFRRNYFEFSVFLVPFSSISNSKSKLFRRNLPCKARIQHLEFVGISVQMVQSNRSVVVPRFRIQFDWKYRRHTQYVRGNVWFIGSDQCESSDHFVNFSRIISIWIHRLDRSKQNCWRITLPVTKAGNWHEWQSTICRNTWTEAIRRWRRNIHWNIWKLWGKSRIMSLTWDRYSSLQSHI